MDKAFIVLITCLAVILTACSVESTIRVRSSARYSRKTSKIVKNLSKTFGENSEDKISNANESSEKLKISIKDREEFKKLRSLTFTKKNRCLRPARKHDNETIELAKKLKKRLDVGLNEYVKDEGRMCHEANKKPRLSTRSIKERRMRRTVEETFGSEATVELIGCVAKGQEDSGTLNMCHDCSYQLTLPDEYLEQTHIVHLCDAEPTDESIDDYSCFAGEGSCVELEVIRNLLKVDSNSYVSSSSATLTGFTSVDFTFTYGCSCQIKTGSLFNAFAN